MSRKIVRLDAWKLIPLKCDGIICPTAFSRKDFVAWRNTFKWRAFALMALINTVSPFSQTQFKLVDRYRLFRCPKCDFSEQTIVGGQHPVKCPKCNTVYGAPIRLTAIKEENCPTCNRPIFYDSLTLVGTCACRRHDLLGKLIRLLQKAMRTDDAELIKVLFKVLAEYHKGEQVVKGSDNDGTSSADG